MKKILLAFALVVISIGVNGQCNTNNATDCKCKDVNQTDCDLLPDIEVGRPPFYLYDAEYGIIEHSQSGNTDPDDNGKLYVTVSTPNPGHGPLEIYTTDTFVCGVDTFYGSPPSICPDGVTYPRVLIKQRIFHKTGNAMTSYTRAAGTMTYHPSHSHMHVDNWGNYSLRLRDSLEANPLNWPMIGAGTKLAFCVMDYGTCPGWANHCLDSAGNSLNSSTDFPNYGLGGGQYSCSAVVQGISSGYMDIYWTSLEGMFIDIPPNLCNGDYYIVCEVDPNNNFLEEDETNNVYAAPFVMTKQLPNPASAPVHIGIASSMVNLCQGESVSLSALINMPNVSYHWSNGDTTAYTMITSPGTYTVDIMNQCGIGTSHPVQINYFTSPAAPIGINDTIPVPGAAIIYATSPLNVSWYDQPVGGSIINTGGTFITPSINVSTTFYAEVEEVHAGDVFNTGLVDNLVSGSGGYSTSVQSLIFDCYNQFLLHTVKVYSPGNNTINVQLRDSLTNVIQTATVAVTTGMNLITLDFLINPGRNYRLTRTGGDLFRNNAGVNAGYPFTVPNVCSITGTTQGSGYYYFFYDWEIRFPDHSCTSSRIPVEAVVSFPNAIAEVSVLNSLSVYPNPANNSVKVSFLLKEENASIELIDALGKTVIKRTVLSNAGLVEETFDVSTLSRGVYNIHILSAGKNFYKRLVIN